MQVILHWALLHSRCNLLFLHGPILFSYWSNQISHGSILFSQRPILFSQWPNLISQGPILFSQRPILFSQGPILFSQRPILFSLWSSLISLGPILFSQRSNKLVKGTYRCRPSKGRRCIPDVIIWVHVKLIIVYKHDSRNFFPGTTG